VLGFVGGEVADDPGDVGVGFGVAALVLGVGPGSELAQQAIGPALGGHLGHTLLSGLGGLVHLGGGLVEETHAALLGVMSTAL
jgi:hypothetical protein